MNSNANNANNGSSARLVAIVDGATLEPDAARMLWEEFSAHMEANKGDVVGFAKAKGWHKLVPEYRQGKAVLVATTNKPGATTSKPAKTSKPGGAP